MGESQREGRARNGGKAGGGKYGQQAGPSQRQFNKETDRRGGTIMDPPSHQVSRMNIMQFGGWVRYRKKTVKSNKMRKTKGNWEVNK